MGVVVDVGERGGGGGGGGGCCTIEGGGGAAIETAPEESKATWEEDKRLASLHLYLIISDLTAFSSACKD